MKRILPITAIALATLVPLSLNAQRGGGGGRGFGGGSHASSGFRSGGSGGMRSFAPARASGPRTFSSAPRTFSSGPRTFAPRSGFAPRGFSPVRRTFFPQRSFGFRRFHNRFFFGNSFFFPGCFGCASPFFFGTGFIGDPYFYSPFLGDYYGPPQPQTVVVSGDNSSNVELANEVGRLSDEVEDLRNENSVSRSYNPSAANPGASLTAKEPSVATVFVFRDGHRLSAKNYAVAGQTLWIFDEHSARKISLAELDAAATEQANSANGVEFHLPEPPAPH